MKAAAVSRDSKPSSDDDALAPTDAPESAWHDPARDKDAASNSLRIRLTAREAEVLALLCEGLPNKMIARRLRISAGTVKVHVSNILRAMDVSTRLQAVVLARRWQLVHEPPVEAMRTQHSRRATHR